MGLAETLSSDMFKMIWPYMPTILFYTIVIIGTYFTQKIVTTYLKKIENEYGSKYGVQFNSIFVSTVIYVIMAFVLIVNLPGISKEAINVISLVFGAIIAFSSSSIIANAMGGIMILIMKPYKIGDIVQVSDYFGEVAEIRLIYTLIENDKRQLITIPNSTIINGVMVNYSKDQHIITSTVSLQYRIDRYTVEKHLLKAALRVNLLQPFVLIHKLGLDTIEYELRGVLKNVGEIITIRSDLNKAIVDEFDTAKIQISSPQHMKVKMFDAKSREIPDGKIKMLSKKYIEKEALAQEKVMFGRAELIKEELWKEQKIRDKLHKEEAKIKKLKRREDIRRELEKEAKTISILKKEEKKVKQLEDI